MIFVKDAGTWLMLRKGVYYTRYSICTRQKEIQCNEDNGRVLDKADSTPGARLRWSCSLVINLNNFLRLLKSFEEFRYT